MPQPLVTGLDDPRPGQLVCWPNLMNSVGSNAIELIVAVEHRDFGEMTLTLLASTGRLSRLSTNEEKLRLGARLLVDVS